MEPATPLAPQSGVPAPLPAEPVQAAAVAHDDGRKDQTHDTAGAGRATGLQTATGAGVPQSVDIDAMPERFPQFGPVTAQLAMACHAEFERQGGAALLSQVNATRRVHGEVAPEMALRLNQLVGEVVYQTLRSHYKGRPKTSNWVYAEGAPVSKEKASRRAANAERSGELLHQFDTLGAPLEDYLAEGIGNCQVLASAVVALARSLGVKANIWHFVDREDEEDEDGDLQSSATHAVCVIGEVFSLDDPKRPAGKYERIGQVDAEHLVTVDLWSGLCSPSKEFAQDFRKKMNDKSAVRKQIEFEVPAEEGTVGGIELQHLSPAGAEWLGMTVDSPFTMRKDIEPDPKYRPE